MCRCQAIMESYKKGIKNFQFKYVKITRITQIVLVIILKTTSSCIKTEKLKHFTT